MQSRSRCPARSATDAAIAGRRAPPPRLHAPLAGRSCGTPRPASSASPPPPRPSPAPPRGSAVPHDERPAPAARTFKAPPLPPRRPRYASRNMTPPEGRLCSPPRPQGTQRPPSPPDAPQDGPRHVETRKAPTVRLTASRSWLRPHDAGKGFHVETFKAATGPHGRRRRRERPPRETPPGSLTRPHRLEGFAVPHRCRKRRTGKAPVRVVTL